MKKYLLVRLAMGPNYELTEALQQFMKDGGRLMVTPGAVISLFKSTATLDQIKKEIDKIEGLLYFLVEATTENCRIEGIPAPISEYFNDIVKVSKLQKSLTELQTELSAAVQNEDYELAAQLKREVNERS